MKKVSIFMAVLFMVTIAGKSYAELGGQVFYKYGTATAKDDRSGEPFTDTYGLAGKNDGDSGSAIAGGLDIPLAKLFGNTLLGEVMVEYAKFSDKKVLQTTSVLKDEALAENGSLYKTSDVTVSVLNVVIAPKYRFDLGKVRPWVIPAGLAFIVNSPPTEDSNYLDVGYHFGAGVEYMLTNLLSIGVDYRNTIASGDPGYKATYSTMGAYVGINF